MVTETGGQKFFEISPAPIAEDSKLFVSPNSSYIFPSNIKLKTFPDKESHIFINDIESCRGRNVQVLHRCYPKQDSSLLQLFIIGKTLSKFALKMEAIIPYLPYARQDKIWVHGEALSAEAVCELIYSAGFSSIATFDCHFLKKPGVFSYSGIRMRNFSLGSSLVEYYKVRKPSSLFISPDQGANYIVNGAGGKSMTKKRGDYKNHKKLATRPVASLDLDFEVNNRDIVILDDMIAGGGTMIKAVKSVLSCGAKTVCCGCTHGLFLSDAYTKIQEAGAEEIISSNTIASEASKIDILGPLKEKIIGKF